MEFDVFFSISQTPDGAGTFPDENTMYSNYLEQLQVADELGYGVAWLAQAHLSTEVQKRSVRSTELSPRSVTKTCGMGSLRTRLSEDSKFCKT